MIFLLNDKRTTWYTNIIHYPEEIIEETDFLELQIIEVEGVEVFQLK